MYGSGSAKAPPPFSPIDFCQEAAFIEKLGPALVGLLALWDEKEILVQRQAEKTPGELAGKLARILVSRALR